MLCFVRCLLSAVSCPCRGCCCYSCILWRVVVVVDVVLLLCVVCLFLFVCLFGCYTGDPYVLFVCLFVLCACVFLLWACSLITAYKNKSNSTKENQNENKNMTTNKNKGNNRPKNKSNNKKNHKDKTGTYVYGEADT